MDPMSVGIVGCGTISDAYLGAGEAFDAFEVVACADLDTERAAAKAAEYDVPWAGTPEAMLAEGNLDLVVNLTPPAVHADVSRSAIESGAHVYTEKPIAVSPDEAGRLCAAADDRDCLIGSAPDTSLGRGVQTARRVLDEGRIGDPIGATAFFSSGGHESWHSDPDLFYGSGGGPLFDMGPYYLTALVHLLGPATRVTGATRRPFDERRIGSGPRAGETVDVTVPTHETGVVDFAAGATATLLFTFDVSATDLAPQGGFEVYGTQGTLRVPDPNGFEGAVRLRTDGTEEWTDVPLVEGPAAQQRGLGIVDLVRALRHDDWTHRTSGTVATHVLEIMAGLRDAGETGSAVVPSTAVDRPPALPASFDDSGAG